MSLKEQPSLWSLNSIYDHWETVLHHVSETTTDTQHSNDMTWQYLKIWRLCACDTASMCLTVIWADTVLQERSFSVHVIIIDTQRSVFTIPDESKHSGVQASYSRQMEIITFQSSGSGGGQVSLICTHYKNYIIYWFTCRYVTEW